MNDRFKFRCWDDYNRVMLDLQEQDTNPYNISDFSQHNIMQCTGLKDKNGKLIYEGDIISCQGKAVIAYSDDKALFYAHYFNTVGICEWYLFELKKIFAQCEVIGNIYENKKLLEDTECQK